MSQRKVNNLGIQAFDEVSPRRDGHVFSVADGTSPQVIWFNSGRSSRIDAVLACNAGATDRVLTLYLPTEFSGDVSIGSVKLPHGAGVAGTPAVDVLGQLKLPATLNLAVQAPEGINCSLSAAVAADGDVTVIAVGGYLAG